MSERHFTIYCDMGERWVAPFLSMLKRMQYLGGIGSSRIVGIYADGDGDFQPHFKWDSDLPPERKPARDMGGDYFYDADDCVTLPPEPKKYAEVKITMGGKGAGTMNLSEERVRDIKAGGALPEEPERGENP